MTIFKQTFYEKRREKRKEWHENFMSKRFFICKQSPLPSHFALLSLTHASFNSIHLPNMFIVYFEFDSTETKVWFLFSFLILNAYTKNSFHFPPTEISSLFTFFSLSSFIINCERHGIDFAIQIDISLFLLLLLTVSYISGTRMNTYVYNIFNFLPFPFSSSMYCV